MLRALILALLLASISARSTAAQTENVKEAINIIVMFCVAGGEKLEVSSSGGGLTLRAEGEDVRISRSEAKGLVEGIRQEMSNITAGQASEARKCMQPYIDRILDVLLGGGARPAPQDRDLNLDRGFGEIFIEWLPSHAPCNLGFAIDMAGQTIVPEEQGQSYHVPNIKLGLARWIIRGRVECSDGSFCESPADRQSGNVSLRAGASYQFFWNIVPGSPRGSECQFALIG